MKICQDCGREYEYPAGMSRADASAAGHRLPTVCECGGALTDADNARHAARPRERRWELSPEVVRNFIEFSGHVDEQSARVELADLAQSAREAETAVGLGEATIYRTGRVSVGPAKRKARLEFTVLPAADGRRERLVKVRNKGI